MSVRTKNSRKVIEVTSPYDPEAVFKIARATNREDVQRTDMFSKMRQIHRVGDEDEVITERDIPMGTVQLSTIMLCLVGWNLKDESGRTYKLTEDNVLDYMTAAERRWLYQEILDLNPVWKGEAEEKDDSEETEELSASPAAALSGPAASATSSGDSSEASL